MLSWPDSRSRAVYDYLIISDAMSLWANSSHRRDAHSSKETLARAFISQTSKFITPSYCAALRYYIWQYAKYTLHDRTIITFAMPESAVLAASTHFSIHMILRILPRYDISI